MESPRTGGLDKAIKFVYGQLGGKHAAEELKALNRVKEVRHPFLLSLERIEVVDNQLLVVTELADCSLKDRFEQCLLAGQPGIPRDELLMYMAEAADALDYLYRKFALQHLDIKPENLLLSGDHIKVADFGLVKDLAVSGVSLMAGLTPMYASPEAFDGRPSRWSDQYCLAIVYQQMLTGRLPFTGESIARLATQHLHSQPDLTLLSAADQPIIARALSKDPQRRFPNCRAMVDALRSGEASAETAATSCDTPSSVPKACATVALAPAAPGGAGDMSGTMVLDVNPAAAAGSDTSTESVAVQSLAAEAMYLPPIELTPGADALRPTLLIGVGGLGARTVLALRKRLQNRLGDLRNTPWLQTLLLDTDSECLADAASAAYDAPVAADDTLAIPLRPTQDYRSRSGQLLRWMSRRWIYNIPRTLRTEGLRPLGRLALVDNRDGVYSLLSQGLDRLTDAETLQRLAEFAGAAPVENTPRIMLIANASGGTGGGAALDVAQCIRRLLVERELTDAPIDCLLACGVSRDPRAAPLAMANSRACLVELNHYLLHGVPGDTACGLPPLPPQTKVFRSVYLMRMNDPACPDQSGDAGESLVEYLYDDLATAVGGFLDRVRTDRGREAADGSAAIATAGASKLSREELRHVGAAARRLRATLLRHWTQGADMADSAASTVSAAMDETLDPQPADAPDRLWIHRCCADFALELDLEPEAMLAHVREAAESLIPGAPDALFCRIMQAAADDEGPTAERFICYVNALFEDERSRPMTSHPKFKAAVDRLVQRPVDVIRRYVMNLLDDPTKRFAGAEQALDTFRTALRALDSKADQLQKQAPAELADAKDRLLELAGGEPLPPDDDAARERYLRFARLKLQSQAVEGLRQIVPGLKVGFAAIIEEVRTLRRDLERLTQATDAPGSADSDQDAEAVLRGLKLTADQTFSDRLPVLSAELRRQFGARLNEAYGGLTKLLSGDTKRLDEAAQWIARVSQRLVLREILLARFADMESAWRRCGGNRRLLLAAPKGFDRELLLESLADALPQPPTIISHDEADLLLCCETENLSLRALAAAVVEDRVDYIEAATRLHTRVDIDWSPL